MKNVLTIILVYLGIFALCFGFSLLIWGGIVWLAVWLLHAIGVFYIGSWAVAFSWKLVLLVALVSSLLTSRVRVRVRND